MKNTLLLFTLLFFWIQLSAQHSKHPTKSKAESKRYSVEELAKPQGLPTPKSVPAAPPAFKFRTLSNLQAPVFDKPNLTMIKDEATNLPIFIKGTVGALEKGNNLEERAISFLEVVKEDMRIASPSKEFQVKNINSDELGFQHIKLQQYWQGVPVYGAEVILHERNGAIRSMTGRYQESASLSVPQTVIQDEEAIAIAKEEVTQYTNVNEELWLGHNLALNKADYLPQIELVVYFKKSNDPTYAIHVSFYPNIQERWECFLDAASGEVITSYKNSCSLHNCSHHNHKHTSTVEKVIEENKEVIDASNFLPSTTAIGPVTASATDLFGINRTINVYQEGAGYFMIDGSRTMFNLGQSNMPDEPVGSIWTIDANNTAPQNSNFSVSHVSSNNNSWNDAISVSAHHNGALAYEYFRNTFNRNSINGQGGNIVSLINVADEDGSSMENAFWNGQAMFYGNGGSAFEPLAKSLDVAGHEMSHGVIQQTANLEYVSQSGAMNESFADIFGAMIDRNDWQVGEDVVNTSVFPSGALRDLSNPNNGGNSLNDPGWQPATMAEYQNLPNTPQGDNGGVHINSGIPNYAYYLLASNIGKSNAEDIYYRALTQYLTKSSQFTDLRIAVTQSATDLFGANSNEVSQVDMAFNTVGIAGGQGGTYEEDVDVNPGSDYIIMTDANLSQIYLSQGDGSNVQVLNSRNIISRPSVTDDGSLVLFVGDDRKLYGITLDWVANTASEFVLQEDPIWRNVAVSKDGARFAAVTNDLDNAVYVYDATLNQFKIFELYNPTFTQGVTTGDVEYADILEWDFSGNFVMYDANNVVESSFGENIEYWDIGFMRVWEGNGWANPLNNIEKLFNGLPENTSIGNPTFAKNSPYIVAFDFIDENNNAQLLATNIETGATSDNPIFTNGILNFPNYSIDDSQIIFDAQDQNGDLVIGIADLNSDKINGVANSAAIFIPNQKWGIWFAEGERELVNTVDLTNEWQIEIFPNPVQEELQIKAVLQNAQTIQIRLLDMTGKVIVQQEQDATIGVLNELIPVSGLANGTYMIQLIAKDGIYNQQFIKVSK